jgi:hypothetical protein
MHIGINEYILKTPPGIKKNLHKNRAGGDGVAQGEGPEFKPQYCKKINTYRECKF